MSQLSIIIPALDEEENLPRLFESLAPLLQFDIEIIVVDGGSTDQTAEVVRVGGAKLISAERGRGRQLLAGGVIASGRLFLFLHADSLVTAKAIEDIQISLANPDFRIALFRLRFDSPRLIYRLYSFFARFDSLWTTFGDQGLLIDRDFYNQLGGFPSTSLFEDVLLLRRARREGRIEKFKGEIITSTRRYREGGAVRLQVRNLMLLSRYLAGGEPESLAKKYRCRNESGDSNRG
ncbi:MAG: TIGR04283 family arsenosugar biosynthesis glycosyltransferase [Ignavibacteriae bacterium]|nr:TIGR04283 family arsenosugar biosynthesis glycosyltransferase [Ignavibacteriota bacterium]MCB9216582.1 TIGR04283 family arsenosugar biosynthesis glycosyltransferase [Ignavibacteria bacterium]